MTQEIAERQQSPAQQLVAAVRGDAFREQVALALPEGVPADRFVRATVTALAANPDLAEQADHGTIYTALLRSAQDGLVPDGREAAVVVYRGKAQYLPMIGGYRKIAAEYGWSLVAEVVYAADEFDHVETIDGPQITHRKARPGTDRGERVAVYAIARKRGETPIAKVLYPEDVARARKSAKTDTVWNEHTDRMWEKTAGKLLFKSLPLGGVDHDRERIRRLIADDPADAAAALYGPQARAALTTGTPVPETTPADAAEPDTVSAGDPQAAGGGEPTTAAPAPGHLFDDEPEPGGRPAEDPGLTEAIEAAADQTVPYGNRAGQTIRQVAQEAVAGDAEAIEWLEWAVGPGRKWAAGPFGAAVRLVVEHRFPAVWASAQKHATGQAA